MVRKESIIYTKMSVSSRGKCVDKGPGPGLGVLLPRQGLGVGYSSEGEGYGKLWRMWMVKLKVNGEG
jgi:hypothetical protein